MGGEEPRRSGIFGDRDPAVLLRGQYVHQHCAGNLGDSVFVAGIYTGKWFQRSESASDAGTAQCDRWSLPGNPEDPGGRNLRTGDGGGSPDISGGVRTAADRDG